jgi:hypothetical protein
MRMADKEVAVTEKKPTALGLALKIRRKKKRGVRS